MLPAILVFFLALLSSNSAAEDPPKVPGLFRQYELDLQMNLPESYTGTLTMEVTMHRTTKQIELITSEKQNIISAQYALKKDKRDWVQLLVHVDPNGRKAIFEMQGKDGEFYNSTVYVLKIQFEGNFTDATEGFYRRKQPWTDSDYYALTEFSGDHACHFFPRFFETTRRLKFRLTVHPQEGYEVAAVDGFMDKNHLQYEIPPTAFGLFIGKFKRFSAKSYTYSILIAPSPGEAVPSAFLALHAGSRVAKNMNQFFVATRTKELYINCVILPVPEPGVADSWGLIYYQGDDMIGGSELNQLLVVAVNKEERSGTKKKRYRMLSVNPRISVKAIFETLLFVAEKNINQAMGVVWLLLRKELKMDSYFVIQSGLVEFLKYKQISRIYGDQGTMDFQYIEHVLPFRWQRIYGFSSMYPLEHEKQHIYMTKSVAILRMYHDFLSDEGFDKVLHSVLGNFGTNILSREAIFEAIAEHMKAKYPNSKITSADMAQTIRTVDLPIITVEWNSFNGLIELDQIKTAKSEKSFWNLPILIEYFPKTVDALLDVTTEGKAIFHELRQEHESVPIDTGAHNWIIMNPGRSVIYHINYPTTLWNRLIERLQMADFGRIHYINRAQLIDDVMVLGMKNYISKPHMQFNLLKYLVHETELLPWTVASRHLKFLYQKIIYEPTSAVRFKEFAAGLVAPLFDRYGTRAPEKNNVKELRSIAIDLACLFGNEKCIEQVQEVIRKTVRENPFRELEANTRDAICCAALRIKSSMMEQHVIRHVFQEKYSGEESDFFRKCMSCATSTDLLIHYTRAFLRIGSNRLKDISIQDRFLENTLYTAAQMIDGYKQMMSQDTVETFKDDTLRRWMFLVANQNTDTSLTHSFNTKLEAISPFLAASTWKNDMDMMLIRIRDVTTSNIKLINDIKMYYVEMDQEIPIGRGP